MLGLKMCFHRAVTFLVLLELSTVCADMNLAKLFGANINNEDAWGKLMELENCPKPQSMGSTIIMVNESLTAGAKFIANPNVTSRFECEFECCYKKKESCNIAVYTAEQKHCYLFNCGQPSICRFDQRDGYTVSLMSETISAKETSVAAPLTKPVTKPQSTTEAAPKQLHILDGCRPAIDKCVTANTECSDKGFCMCKKGFHPKNGVCRKDCLQGLEFECTNGESKYAQPDCIAVYDVCDGTPQCADGSDEKDCNKDSFDWSSLGSASQVKDKIKGNEPSANTNPKAISNSQSNSNAQTNAMSGYGILAPGPPVAPNSVHMSDRGRGFPSLSTNRQTADTMPGYANFQRKNAVRMPTYSHYPENKYSDSSPYRQGGEYGWGDRLASLHDQYEQRTELPSWRPNSQVPSKWAQPAPTYKKLYEDYDYPNPYYNRAPVHTPQSIPAVHESSQDSPQPEPTNNKELGAGEVPAAKPAAKPTYLSSGNATIVELL